MVMRVSRCDAVICLQDKLAQGIGIGIGIGKNNIELFQDVARGGSCSFVKARLRSGLFRANDKESGSEPPHAI
jgi:hypothetical protein